MLSDNFRRDFFDLQLTFSKIDAPHRKWGQYNLSILRMLSQKVSSEKKQTFKMFFNICFIFYSFIIFQIIDVHILKNGNSTKQHIVKVSYTPNPKSPNSPPLREPLFLHQSIYRVFAQASIFFSQMIAQNTTHSIPYFYHLMLSMSSCYLYLYCTSEFLNFL